MYHLHKILATQVVFHLTYVCLMDEVSFSGSTRIHTCNCTPRNLCADEFLDEILVKFGEQCENEDQICCKNPMEIEEPTYRRKGCGKQNDNPITLKIIGRENYETSFGEFPWMVMIMQQLNETNEEGSPYYTTSCSGSLIHEKVVLTAAHCVEEKGISKFKLRAGEWDVTLKTEPAPHQDRDVEQILIHPNYYRAKNMITNDIALVVVTEPFEFAENVEITCLPKRYEKFTKSDCMASGWGKNGIKGVQQTKLRKVSLPIVPANECEKKLRTKLGRKFKLHISSICAGGEIGYDTCQGDGGGPLVCRIGASESFQQVGIVSWGIGCANTIPGVYTDVSYFRDWIDTEMRKLNFQTEYDYREVLEKSFLR